MTSNNPYLIEPALQERLKKYLSREEIFSYNDNMLNVNTDFGYTKYKGYKVQTVRFTKPKISKARKKIETKFPGITIETFDRDIYVILPNKKQKIGSGVITDVEIKKTRKKLKKAAKQPGQTTLNRKTH